MQNPMQIIQQFNQFKQSFRGNPKDEVMKLVNSGKMSQSQLNQLQNMAGELTKLLK